MSEQHAACLKVGSGHLRKHTAELQDPLFLRLQLCKMTSVKAVLQVDINRHAYVVLDIKLKNTQETFFLNPAIQAHCTITYLQSAGSRRRGQM